MGIGGRLEALQAYKKFRALRQTSEPLRELAERTRTCHRVMMASVSTLERRVDDRDWNAYRRKELAKLNRCTNGCNARTLVACGVPRDLVRLVVDFFRRCRLALADGIDPAPTRIEADKLYSDLITEADAATSDPERRPAVRRPLTPNAKRIASALLKLAPGQSLGRKDLPAKTGVPKGSLSRALRELRNWGMEEGPRGSGFFIPSDCRQALAEAIKEPK